MKINETLVERGILLLKTASERASVLEKGTLEKCANLAVTLLPYLPEQSGRVMLKEVRVFRTLSGIEDKAVAILPPERLEEEIESVEEALCATTKV